VVQTSEVASIGAGGSISFPVAAWSNAPLAWPVNVVQTSPAPPALGLTLSFGNQTVMNGAQGTLTLTVPASTPPDSTFTVELESQSATQYAYWPITVYVPSGGVVSGAPVGCTVPSDGGVDPCLASGTVCAPPSGAISLDGTCALPNELDPCLASVGCSDSSLVCLATTDGGLCLQTCTTSRDCADPTTACLTERGQQACWPNACGPGTANGSTYYAACNASDAGDGTCLPSGASGLCLAIGPVDAGQECQYTRVNGGSHLCTAGDICVDSAEGRSLSLCEPLCDADGGGPTCGSGETCAPVWGNVGACTPLCTGAGPACPANTTCTLVPPGTDLCSW
jgi:hypothetical protein